MRPSALPGTAPDAAGSADKIRKRRPSGTGGGAGSGACGAAPRPALSPFPGGAGAEPPQGYTPAEWTAATALRAATRIGSQTGENGGA
ncbi:hypothetical protein Snoj_08340 [Streptomyces nojiriensis]|uniref:Uncharacterized protein n=1 Tax=Streptomyces nojiriensis TaxID=66374 RepID=A0ABQ3SFK2_9ACTN|nr:hypothetical protein GCM10010205_35690 [Streptomyces nojiriensis]GHI66916.1 hypothetical protein Snoj_08340 [Streptomyces nojiriensis]